VKLEWLILADHAEVLGGKLYLMGGGWDVFTAGAFPAPKHAAIAVAFQVPWNETNQRHNVEIEIADQDGRSIAKMGGQLEVGRPAGIALGQAQRVPLVVEANLLFEKPGTYVVTASIEGEEAGRVSFNVIAAPGTAPSH
jgi:hypothetical protein